MTLGVSLINPRSSNSASVGISRLGRCCPRRHNPLGRLRLGRLGRARFSSHAGPIHHRSTPLADLNAQVHSGGVGCRAIRNKIRAHDGGPGSADCARPKKGSGQVPAGEQSGKDLAGRKHESGAGSDVALRALRVEKGRVHRPENDEEAVAPKNRKNRESTLWTLIGGNVRKNLRYIQRNITILPMKSLDVHGERHCFRGGLPSRIFWRRLACVATASRARPSMSR
jgi:hypothetical protein